MSRITSSHLLDRDLFDFENLNSDAINGLKEFDIAFDESPMETLMQRSYVQPAS